MEFSICYSQIWLKDLWSAAGHQQSHLHQTGHRCLSHPGHSTERVKTLWAGSFPTHTDLGQYDPTPYMSSSSLNIFSNKNDKWYVYTYKTQDGTRTHDVIGRSCFNVIEFGSFLVKLVSWPQVTLCLCEMLIKIQMSHPETCARWREISLYKVWAEKRSRKVDKNRGDKDANKVDSRERMKERKRRLDSVRGGAHPMK